MASVFVERIQSIHMQTPCSQTRKDARVAMFCVLVHKDLIEFASLRVKMRQARANSRRLTAR